MEKVKIQFEVGYFTTKEALIKAVVDKMSDIEDDYYAEKIRASITWKGETIDLGVGRLPK